jgi:outer membrane protein assembly factor BamB
MSQSNFFGAFIHLVCCFSICGPCSLTRGADNDWPRWRGEKADASSHEKGLLQSWPKDGPPLAWQCKGLGSGFSSLAIVGDRIFSMGLKDGSGVLVCLNRADGSKIWETAFGSGDPNCTPTTDGEHVYGLARNGELACLKIADGALVWQKSFTKDFGGSEPTWGYSESPLVDGDALICSPGSNDAFIVALNKLTGAVMWKTPLDTRVSLKGHGGAGYSSPVISNGGGLKQYVTLTGKGLASVHAKTGELLWVYDRVSNGTANIPTPIVKGDFILCSSGYGDGGTALIQLNKQGKTVAWKEIYYYSARDLQNHHGGMILIGDYVYMGEGHNNGFPVCFDFKTGKPTWQPGRGPGRESAAVAYADGHLYFRYQDATMALIEANPRSYKLKGSFKIGIHNRESWSHPVISGGMLYLRDQDDLVVYDIRAK